MNFVIKLLKLKNPITLETFNSIIIIYNKFSKYVIIILIKEIYKAE
jgi:hypothetical protein